MFMYIQHSARLNILTHSCLYIYIINVYMFVHIQVFDAVIYLFLSYLLSEVFPSAYSVSKPIVYFTKSIKKWVSDRILFMGFAPINRYSSSNSSYNPIHSATTTEIRGDYGNDVEDEEVNIQMNPILTNTNINSNINMNTSNTIPTGDNAYNTTYTHNNTNTVYPSEPDSLTDIRNRSPASITINLLRKTYNGQLAVNHVSLDLYEGEVFALLGHNGAGMTVYPYHIYMRTDAYICMYM